MLKRIFTFFVKIPVKGVEVNLHWSLLLMPLITGTFLIAGFLCLNLGIHELAHFVVARYKGCRADKMYFTALGAVVMIDEQDMEKLSPFGRASIFLAGPLSNLLTALVLFPFSGYLKLFASVALFIGIFNLIPVYPLDGGKILHEILTVLRFSKKNKARTILICSLTLGIPFLIFNIMTQSVVGSTLIGLILTVCTLTFYEDAFRNTH